MGRIRVFVYESSDRGSAIVKDIEIDDISSSLAAELLSNISDARFGFESSVPSDEDDSGETLYAEMRLEGTIRMFPDEGVDCFHDLYIHSVPDKTTVDECDWAYFVQEAARLNQDFYTGRRSQRNI